MPAHLKRKASGEVPATQQEATNLGHGQEETVATTADAEVEDRDSVGPEPLEARDTRATEEQDEQSSKSEPAAAAAVHPVSDRQARFKALQARQAESRSSNRKETALETQRQSSDPHALTSLSRKRDVALQKLQRDDAATAGEDYERKRAWDWTIEESERWDKRMAKKDKRRDDTAFQDYRAEARKTYKRQMRDLKPDMEAYEREKVDAVRRAAEAGGLDIVETEDGDVVAVDRDGGFYATADSTAFAQNKPAKARVDALVDDLKKAEEVRLRKRRERGRADDDGDISYINEKNKQFNQKLARFYNKYTADIRDSFERGTAI